MRCLYAALVMLSIIGFPGEALSAGRRIPRQAGRTAVLRAIGSWRSAWQRCDLNAYMSHYSKDAHVARDAEDVLTFNYQSYFQWQRKQFAHDRAAHAHRMGIDHLALHIQGTKAVARFGTQLDLGGGTRFGYAWGTRELKLRRTAVGNWVIYDDVSNLETDI